MSELFADLHLHTTHSDGTLSPSELIQRAHAIGLQTVAITDHDSVGGIAEADAAARPLGMRVIAGLELTACRHRQELHVVGLFVDRAEEQLLTELERLRRGRRERVKEMGRRLAKLGAPVQLDELISSGSAERAVGRSHVAMALVAAGHANSIAEAFELYIGEHAPAYVPRPPWSIQQAVGLIHRAKGLAALAHPGDYRIDAELPAILPQFDALEVFCPKHSPSQQERYATLARRFGLPLSGGSDDHGAGKDESLIGRVKLPLALLDELERRWLDAQRARCGSRG